MPSVDELAADLQIERLDAENIHNLLLRAHARGLSGRWPDQDFERADDWTAEGDAIDRAAAICGIAPRRIFMLYRASHAEGLVRRRQLH